VEPWQWLILALGALLVGVSKTAVAGLGILAVALFATVLPARDSVGIVLITLIAGDLVAIASYRREASWPHLWRLFPWAAAGVVLGALAFGRFDDTSLRRFIGLTLAVLALLAFVRQRTNFGGDGEGLAKHPWLIRIVGLTAGFATMVANAAGPIMVLYLLAQKLPKKIFIGTAAWYFLFLNLFKVPFSAGLGLINPATLSVALWLIPVAVAGALIGKPLLEKIDQKLFEQLALTLTVIAGVRLLFT
jgi:uncharacterized protein